MAPMAGGGGSSLVRATGATGTVAGSGCAARLIFKPLVTGAIGGGGAVCTGGGGAEVAGTGDACIIRGELVKLCASKSFAAAVPSRWQTGQFTVNGMRPFTGSTSNLYFWPHWQITFSSIRISSDAAFTATGWNATTLILPSENVHRNSIHGRHAVSSLYLTKYNCLA